MDSFIKKLIEDHVFLKSGMKSLDIGCGKGDLSVWLTKKYLICEAIDKKNCFVKKDEKVNFSHIDVRDYKFKKSFYNLIVAIDVLQFISRNEKYLILDKIISSLEESGYLVIRSFTVDEPYYKKNLSKLSNIEKTTLVIGRDNLKVSFFEKNELYKWSQEKELMIHFYKEEIVNDDHPPLGKHIHGIVTLVAQKC